jgi:phosphate transport system permease protein
VGIEAMPAIQQFGFGFITNSTWNPIADQYGALPHIYGTLVSAAIALIIALPIGIGVAIFLSEDFLGDRAQQILIFLVELLAAIPSVVYGLWGIFVLVPRLRDLGMWLHQNLGAIAIFSTAPEGRGMYVAGVVLGIMILPIIAAISRESLAAVPVDLRQAALGLGATRWEAILKVILPAAASGIIGGTMLALGRALGETMAVTMLIGNSNQISPSVLAPASTIAALLANQFGEASGLQVSALMYAAFILFGLTLLVNILAELLVRKIKRGL